MIMYQYIIKQLLKNQFILLLSLLLIFFCKQLIQALSKVISGQLPLNLIWHVMGFELPYIVQFILPLSLFLSLLMTYRSMYNNNEMIAAHAGGFSRLGLFKLAWVLALFTLCLAIINSVWLTPMIGKYQPKIVREIQNNVNTKMMQPGKFHKVSHSSLIFFIHKIDNNIPKYWFVASGKPIQNSSLSYILLADDGFLKRNNNGSHNLKLNNGTIYSGTMPSQEFHITQFNSYMATINGDVKQLLLKNNIIQLTGLYCLLKANDRISCVELHWRLTIFIGIPLMAMLAVPFSVATREQQSSKYILIALSLYLAYFVFLSVVRSLVDHNEDLTVNYLWIVNLGYFMLTLVLNYCTGTLNRFKLPEIDDHLP